MEAKIKNAASPLPADLEQVLKDWQAGKEVRSLELGHSQQEERHPDGSHSLVPLAVRNDQARAYAYFFHLIELFKLNGVPRTFELFQTACDAYEELFREETDELTKGEVDGAESLAWKALTQGWARAIDGFKETQYIQVRKP